MREVTQAQDKNELEALNETFEDSVDLYRIALRLNRIQGPLPIFAQNAKIDNIRLQNNLFSGAF